MTGNVWRLVPDALCSIVNQETPDGRKQERFYRTQADDEAARVNYSYTSLDVMATRLNWHEVEPKFTPLQYPSDGDDGDSDTE